MLKGKIHSWKDVPRIAALEVLELSVTAMDDIIHIIHTATHDAELETVAQLLEVLRRHV